METPIVYQFACKINSNPYFCKVKMVFAPEQHGRVSENRSHDCIPVGISCGRGLLAGMFAGEALFVFLGQYQVSHPVHQAIFS